MDLKDKVTEIVEDLCDNLTSFTSLDVSNKVKQQGFESIRHREIANLVRVLFVDGLMEDFGFTRSLIDVNILNGGTRQAYLYHHQSISPSNYDRRSQVAIPPKSSDSDQDDDDAPIQASATSSNVSQSNTSQLRRQKGDCRLEIPASWVKHLGWTDGNTIYAVHENDIILKEPSDVSVTDTVLATTMITDGRLRVPKTAFEKAGFQSYNGRHHEVVLDAGKIIVKDA